jgi:hypothetical protein
MARVNAQQWLQKWGNALSASGTAITNGVNAVKTAAQDRMPAGLTNAGTAGAWAKAVSAVSLQQWQASMLSKGLPHIAQGVALAQQTKVKQVTDLLNAVDASVASLSALPKGGIENNINRATAFMRAMSANAPKKNQ